MVRKLFISLLACLLLLTATALADLQVIDDAKVLDSAEEAAITSVIEHIEGEHQVDLIVLTTEDTPYDGTEDLYYVRNFADDYYDQHGYGMGPDNSGMLILLDMHNRAVWLSTGGVMRAYIDDSREEDILDACYEDLQYGNYGDGLLSAVERVAYYMDKGREEGTFLYDEATGERLGGIYNALTGMELLAALASGLIVAVAVAVSIKSSYGLKGSTYRYDLASNARIQLTRDDEKYLRETVTRTARSQDSSNGGGGSSGGGSGVHTSSGGVSHGGGGRRF